MLFQLFWWLILSLFLIVSFFWCCFPKSLLLTFHSWVSLESWPSIPFPPILPHLYLFKLSFLAAFPFCHFSQVIRILLCQVKGFPNYFPLQFFFLGYPKYQPFARELSLSKPSIFTASLCLWERHICPSFLVLFGSPLELSQSHFGCATRPRNLEPSSFYWTLFNPLILAGWVLFFLPSVSWALKTCSFMDFGFQIFWAYHPFLLWAQPPLILLSMGFAQCAISLGLVSWFFRPQHPLAKADEATK